MRPLTGLSTRPEFLVDPQGNRVIDPVFNIIGIPGPFGRNRIVEAIPLNESRTGPVQLAKARVLQDQNGFYLSDPAGNLIGVPAVWVGRMLYARWTEDTRRLT